MKPIWLPDSPVGASFCARKKSMSVCLWGRDLLWPVHTVTLPSQACGFRAVFLYRRSKCNTFKLKYVTIKSEWKSDYKNVIYRTRITSTIVCFLNDLERSSTLSVAPLYFLLCLCSELSCHIEIMFTPNFSEHCPIARNNSLKWTAIKNGLILLHIFLCKSVKQQKWGL